jgi:hypothetical protein
MKQNRITRLKNKLIEDITIIEQNKTIKHNNLNNKIYIESPDERRIRELTEQISSQQRRDFTELGKELEKENEMILLKILEDMKKKKN